MDAAAQASSSRPPPSFAFAPRDRLPAPSRWRPLLAVEPEHLLHSMGKPSFKHLVEDLGRLDLTAATKMLPRTAGMRRRGRHPRDVYGLSDSDEEEEGELRLGEAEELEAAGVTPGLRKALELGQLAIQYLAHSTDALAAHGAARAEELGELPREVAELRSKLRLRDRQVRNLKRERDEQDELVHDHHAALQIINARLARRLLVHSSGRLEILPPGGKRVHLRRVKRKAEQAMADAAAASLKRHEEFLQAQSGAALEDVHARHAASAAALEAARDEAAAEVAARLAAFREEDAARRKALEQLTAQRAEAAEKALAAAQRAEEVLLKQREEIAALAARLDEDGKRQLLTQERRRRTEERRRRRLADAAAAAGDAADVEKPNLLRDRPDETMSTQQARDQQEDKDGDVVRRTRSTKEEEAPQQQQQQQDDEDGGEPAPPQALPPGRRGRRPPSGAHPPGSAPPRDAMRHRPPKRRPRGAGWL